MKNHPYTHIIADNNGTNLVHTLEFRLDNVSLDFILFTTLYNGKTIYETNKEP